MVSVIDTIKPAGNFAVAEAPDIQVGDKRLDEVLDGKAKSSDVAALQSGKVDKVAGKGLSTNDYSDAEKSKLSSVESAVAKHNEYFTYTE